MFSSEEMKEMIDTSVCEVIELRRMQMRRPDPDKSYVNVLIHRLAVQLMLHSLTAVVRGAVIYGVEQSRHKDATYMSAITRSYGIVLHDRFEWLVRKGDLVLSTEKRIIRRKWFWESPRAGPVRKFDMPVWPYCGKEDDVPLSWQDGQFGRSKQSKLKHSKADRDPRGRTGRNREVRLF